jgi:hypothetical protein
MRVLDLGEMGVYLVRKGEGGGVVGGGRRLFCVGGGGWTRENIVSVFLFLFGILNLHYY